MNSRKPLWKRSRRIALSAVAAAVVASFALVGAVAAGARDGRGSDDGTARVETRGHDQEQEAARQEDRRQDDSPGDAADGKPLLAASLAPSVPTDPAIHAVAAGGLPWVLDRGTVRLQADGRIRVKVQGLVIPVAHGGLPAGTARPVTTVSASLYCAPDTTAAVGATGAVPISEGGDATIDETITLPGTCLAPIVLVHPNGAAGAYIAVTGWRS
jgi:hypothetical protein